MDEELKIAIFYGLMTGFGAGALRWLWSFFVRRVLSLLDERLILE